MTTMSSDTIATTPAVLRRKSPYQTIEWRRRHAEWTLKLNGGLQVHSRSERIDHEACATLPLMLAQRIDKILILGGGDGFSARNILEFKGFGQTTLVELCPAMIDLFSGELACLNDGALSNSQVKVVVGDGIKWLFDTKEKFDVIINDLEHEDTDQPMKQTAELVYQFNKAIADRLNDGGIFTTSVSDEDGIAQLNAVYEIYKHFAPVRKQREFQRKRTVMARARVLLECLYPHVREWDVDDRFMGRRVNFYASKSPIKKIHRWPRIEPHYITDEILSDILHS